MAFACTFSVSPGLSNLYLPVHLPIRGSDQVKFVLNHLAPMLCPQSYETASFGSSPTFLFFSALAFIPSMALFCCLSHPASPAFFQLSRTNFLTTPKSWNP